MENNPAPKTKINIFLLSLIYIIALIPGTYLLYISRGTSNFPIALIISALNIILATWVAYLFTQKTQQLPEKLKKTYSQLLNAKQNLEQQTITLVHNALSINEYHNKLEDRQMELIQAKENLEKQNVVLAQNSEKLKKYQVQLEARNFQLQKALEKTQQLSQSLAHEKEQMEILLQSMTEGVFAVDQNLNIILFNHAAQKITGLDKDQVLNQNIDQTIKLFTKDDRLVPLSEYANQDESKRNELWNTGLIFKSGSNLVYLSLSVSPVRFAEGQSGWIITAHDKTQEQQLEAMKLDFVSMAAHELRTPLTTIKGYISMIQQSETMNKLDDTEKDILNRALNSSIRLNKLIENLLIVSKIEKQEVNLNLEPVKLNELAKSSVEEYQVLANEKKLKLFFVPPEQPIPEIKADSSRITEVFSNLIGNAIHYTDQGEIKVSVRRENNQVITSIQDTGKGIPKEALPHLFTKFFRVKSTLVEGKSKGTGLGLYISKNIIDGHGGKIWVESEPDKGSTFYFSLPVTSFISNQATTR